MKEKLPVYIENRELPVDRNRIYRNNSYGYVNVMYILSLIVTGISVGLVILLGK